MISSNVKMFHRNTKESSSWYHVVSQIGWVGFVSKELHSFVKSKSNPTISPDLNLSTCYWAFVWFICGIIWTPPHMLCHVWWFIKRGLCPQHQLGSKKKLKSRWTRTEGTCPSSWSTNWTDLYYKHKHKRRPVISRIPSCFFCLPKRNFAQR